VCESQNCSRESSNVTQPCYSCLGCAWSAELTSPEDNQTAQGRIWNVLLARAARALDAYTQRKSQPGRLVELAEGLDYESLMALVRGRDVCVGEFELLQLMAAWCR
jgi:hypothetical protein